MTGSAAKARSYALTLLRYLGRSEKELRDRLRKKGYQQEDIDAAVVNLRDSGFLDDEALAENLKRQAMTNKLLGFDGARRFTQQRGIPRTVIDPSTPFRRIHVQQQRRVLNNGQSRQNNLPHRR